VSYPLFLVVASIGVLCFVLLYVVPQFEVALQGFRDKIDPSALVVFQISRFFKDNVSAFATALIALLALLLVVRRLGRGRSLFIRALAKLPFTRRIVTYDLTLTFCRRWPSSLETASIFPSRSSSSAAWSAASRRQ
jgi:general secretion pathway protein F